MEAFTTETSKAIVIPNDDIDTDILIPKQFLKNILRTGFGINAFYPWRYHDDGTPVEDFPLNQKAHQGATILITGDNFGCGSSREHAVWALTDYGFRAVIAGGFSDIFFMNATKNGLLPIILPEADRAILRQCQADEPVTIDLVQQIVKFRDHTFHFDINATWKEKFLKGQDDISLTEQYEDQIKAYEAKRPVFE
ncbi:3-isopropylmalate dehydratase small subunit [Lacticaseibacillus sp. N501-2]|uniref:3-isopropylmalate dehydratase small subunit n=1 Tax=Lacticaseibacillus salsurae TaxID=3367729 RepID=UPI0038B2C106